MPALSTLKKLNAVSGLVFAIFLVLHFLSHYMLVWGWEKAREAQVLFRVLYHNLLGEVVLFASLGLHMFANFMIYQARNKHDDIATTKKTDTTVNTATSAKVSNELYGHRIAGYILAIFIGGHVGATRLVPVWVLQDQAEEYDYSFVAKANVIVPFNIFLVYYIVLGIAGGWHMIYGVRSALATLRGENVANKEFPMQLKFMAMMSHIAIVAAVLCLCGYNYSVDLDRNADLHDKLYAAMGMI